LKAEAKAENLAEESGFVKGRRTAVGPAGLIRRDETLLARVLLNLQDSVLRTVGIRLADGAGGIVTPLAIDDEAVLVRSGREFDGRAPDTGWFLFELNRFFLPLSEVAGEQDTLRVGRSEGEDLLFTLDLFCHVRVLSIVVSGYSLMPEWE
jgi:hypothetical protein